MSSKRVYLSLGSNVAAERNLPRAIRLLAERVEVLALSRVWETPAVPPSRGRFLNAAAALRTGLGPQALKREVLRPVEAALGRVRGADKFAPRPIDLDIILHGGRLLEPDLWRYAHLAAPLADLIPGYTHPVSGETLAQAAARLRPASGFRLRPEVALEG